MHIDISLIPTDVVNFCKAAGNFTTKLQTDLESNTAIVVATLIDDTFGTQLAAEIRTGAITVTEDALSAINKLENAVQTPAVEAIFQRLGSDLAQLAHNDAKHDLSYYISCFETVLHDIFNKGNATVTTTA